RTAPPERSAAADRRAAADRDKHGPGASNGNDNAGRKGTQVMKTVVPTELARGQLIIVLARWLLVLAGLVIALWSPQRLLELQIEVGVLLLVAIANFHLHAQLVQRKPTLKLVAQAASIGDLLVITLLIALQG